MKTQITNLINGMKNVVRDEQHEKYLNAKPATSHIGYAGSENRAEIAQRVFAENGETLNIMLSGVELQLHLAKSTTGKTLWYTCELSEEIANQFMFTNGNSRSYTLIIDSNMTVCINKFVRRNERAKWRFSYYQYIDEAFITIL